MNLLTSKKLLAVLVSSALLSACGSSSNDATTEVPKPEISKPEVVKYSTVVLDATDASQAAKLDLVSGSAVTDTTWQIAYQKYAGFKLNGGVSGSGKVSGCVAHEYKDLFDKDGNPVVDKFKALTAASSLTVFDSITATSCTDFETDALKTFIKTGDWLSADYSTGAPVYSAKAGNGWIVRSADGEAYSRVKVKTVTVAFGQTTTRKVILSSELWNGSVFEASVDSPALDFSSDRVFWDLETNTLVTEADDWDLSLMVNGRDYPLQVNGGAGAVVHKGGLDAITDPTDSKQVYKYFPDSAAGVLSSPGDFGALEYAVAGGHEMWPTFTTYLIKDEADSGTRLFKVQLISNKGETGELASANLVFRYQEVTQ